MGEPFGMAWGWGGGGLDFNLALRHMPVRSRQCGTGAAAIIPLGAVLSHMEDRK